MKRSKKTTVEPSPDRGNDLDPVTRQRLDRLLNRARAYVAYTLTTTTVTSSAVMPATNPRLVMDRLLLPSAARRAARGAGRCPGLVERTA